MSAPPLPPSQWFLLEWLSKEDWSSYGECIGIDLAELIAKGLAVLGPIPEGRDHLYRGVALTDAGWDMLRQGRRS